MKRVVALALFAAACGGSDDRVDAFIGTWTYGDGSISNFDCDNNALDRMETIMDNLVFQAGADSDLIIMPDPDDTCPPTKLNVSGSVAKAEGNGTCTTMPGAGLTAMTTVQDATATLDDEGKAITITAHAAAVFSGSAQATCTLSITGNATKTGN